MGLFKRVFGSGGAKSAKAAARSVEYEGFSITATPICEGSKYRISARIDKEVADETLSHTLIRADVMDGLDDAVEASLRKAKQMIDEQGERLFR